jgi:outer membrane biosynthesis protein TonB
MKLTLRGYSLYVDFANPQARESFLIFHNEENGELVRLPVPEETIVQLMSSVGITLEDEAEAGEEEVEQQEEPEVEEQEEEEPAPEPPPRRPAKTLSQPPAPHVYSSARARIRTPTSEDDVPSV